MLLFAVRASAAGSAPQPTDAKVKLEEVRARIAAVTQRVGAELEQRDELRARLRQAELDITAKRRRLDGLRAEEVAAERRRARLRADAERNQHELLALRAMLAAEVRAAYLNGSQEPIKLLLNQSDPTSAARMAAYYGYFGRARAKTLESVAQHLRLAHELLAQIEHSTAALQALQSDASREIAGLEEARAARLAALTAVSQQVSSGSLELAQLKHEEAAEEALLADLARVLEDFPVDSQQSFAALRGKLPWPVPGRLSVRFQDVKANSGASPLRWNGVLIQTAHGAKVRAVYAGRVVYADWLQGLGLLIIIGHNGDFMTLYGHAEVLYKSVGDWVAPGDVIAALSDSGAAPELYFEIREGREPKDPLRWLKPAP